MAPQAANDNREAILLGVRDRLKAMPDDQIEAVTDPASVAARMAQMVPSTPGEFGQIIGPVYSTQALMTLWDLTRAAVSKRAKEGKVLTLPVEGRNLFPVFQFDRDAVREDVLEVVGVLREVVDPFTIAQWLQTPQADDPDGRTPMELLDIGQKEAVLTAARRTSARWAA